MKHINFILFNILLASIFFCSCGGNEEVDRAFRAASADLGKNMVRQHAELAYKDIDELNMEDACKLTLSYYYIMYDDFKKPDRECFQFCYEKATTNRIVEANTCFNELTGKDNTAEMLRTIYSNLDGFDVIDDCFEDVLQEIESE